MRQIFFFFTLFILLSAEMLIGTIGIYLPLCWMGFFYFYSADYNRKMLWVCGTVGAIFADLILYMRIILPDLFILFFIIYSAWRNKDFWRVSIWQGSLFGAYLLAVSYIIQFAASLATQGFSWEYLSAQTAMMTALAPVGYFLQLMIIYLADLLQKKMKFESAFISENKDNSPVIYRRRTADD